MIPEMESRNLLVADLVGTIALLAVTIVSAISQSDPVQIVSLAVSGLLFLGGTAAWAIGFLRAVGRSRDETIDLAGLFYLTGSAPDPVRKAFLRLWFAQIAIATASVAVCRPPFTVMAPVWGIGLITWWAARHATFSPRPDAPRR